MSSKRSTRGRETPPALPPGTSLAKIKRLPVATLQLYLNQYHLAQDGIKSAKAKRLYDYLQAQLPSSSSSSSENDPGSDEPSNPEEEPTSRSNTDGSSDEDIEGGDQASAPFTKAQRKALAETIQSALRARSRKRPRAHRSPTISSPSDNASKGRKSRTPTHSKRTRHPRHSSSSSSSSHPASATSSSSDSSPGRHRRSRRTRHREREHHHHHYRRAARHQHHTLPVPRKVRRAIEQGEFVELSKLLSDHLVLSGSASSSRSSRSRSTRPITGLDTWLEAWSIYAAVLSTSKPHLAADLFQYQAFITRSSRRFRPYAWLQYDAQFRLKMASNPDMKWSTTDPELVATWLSADATKRSTICYSCGSPDHLSTDCPLRDAGNTPSSRCNSSGHTARDCPNLSTGQLT